MKSAVRFKVLAWCKFSCDERLLGVIVITLLISTMLAKSLGTPLLILPCFAIPPPLPLGTMLFCGKKIGMTGRSATLLGCWDNNLQNQHCFRGEGVFEPDSYG